jgi:hypothetical protein
MKICYRTDAGLLFFFSGTYDGKIEFELFGLFYILFHSTMKCITIISMRLCKKLRRIYARNFMIKISEIHRTIENRVMFKTNLMFCSILIRI